MPPSDATDALRSAVRSALAGEGVLFLGAGAGRAAHRKDTAPLPTGQELSDALAVECQLGKGYSLENISEHFVESRSETTLINALRRLLKVEKVDLELTTLAKIPWARIWTTNYDDAFEIALDGEKRTHYSLTTADGVQNAQGNRLVLLHINGALKRLNQALTADFVLTSQSYATQAFLTSEWSTVFRHDLQRAQAVIFVGYSLADIDVARLIFNPALLHQKIHFIDRTDIDPVLRTKLSRFGTVHPIGLAGFQKLVSEESTVWVPPAFVEAYQCYSKVSLIEGPRDATDNDFYELILKGEIADGPLQGQFEKPDPPRYTVLRSCEAPCIKHLGQPNAVAVLIGSFANGKTLTTRSVALQLAASGQEVFFLDQSTDAAHTELQRMCRREQDFVLLIENYSRNLDLVEVFAKYARTTCTLLVSERTEVHELRSAAFVDRTKGREIRIFDLDLLDNTELPRMSALLTLHGLWGERAGLSELQRIAYLRHDSGAQLQAVLIDVAKSPQVRRRLDEIVTHFRSVRGGLRVLITLCLLQAVGEQPRIDVVSDLLQLSYDSFLTLTKDDVARQIIGLQSGIAHFRSPVMATAVLNGLKNATAVTDIVAECVKRAERARYADSYLGEIAKELMRFGNLERILPSPGKREALQNLYEDLKTVPSIRSNPHYWLQYAIARLSLGELEIARFYFQQAYALAAKMTGYDTFQIDNHYCRLLLLEAESASDSDAAFRAVNEALTILKKQVLRENRHYPYRASWNLEGVSKRHGSAWTDAQRKVVAAGAAYLLDAAKNLDDQVARSVAVVGALERLRRVIDVLS